MPATIPADLDAVQAVSTTQVAGAGDPPGDARVFSKALKVVRGAWTSLLDAAQVRALRPTIRTVTGAATLATTDDYLRVDSAGSVAITVPTGITVGVTVVQAGAGQVSLVAATGVTLNFALKTGGQGQAVSLVPQAASNVHDVLGGVA